ncbi:hypothetical protein B0T22DRAFT_472051 [Podospora appendiculata]|uniref:Uncharacterized protein n=1 Tax=Podospora appendiculata TaxID=314037 RepID=A0AAE0X1R1_9PEZI|nr:hypothetical protein B0T22DRAFT_472051 [Podospora appendiculata]
MPDRGPGGEDIDENEVKEIWSEDSALIQVLETLMEEFQQVKFSSEDEFWDFLDNTWPPRVDEIIADMARLEESEGRKESLRSIGVELVCEEEGSHTEKRAPLLEKTVKDANYWIRRMDEIVGKAY